MHLKDIFSGIIIRGVVGIINGKKKVCFMLENHVYDLILMVLKEHFRMRRLRSRGTSHGHAYCRARPARSIIESMLQDSWLLHTKIMVFFFLHCRTFSAGDESARRCEFPPCKTAGEIK